MGRRPDMSAIAQLRLHRHYADPGRHAGLFVHVDARSRHRSQKGRRKTDAVAGRRNQRPTGQETGCGEWSLNFSGDGIVHGTTRYEQITTLCAKLLQSKLMG